MQACTQLVVTAGLQAFDGLLAGISLVSRCLLSAHQIGCVEHQTPNKRNTIMQLEIAKPIATEAPNITSLETVKRDRYGNQIESITNKKEWRAKYGAGMKCQEMKRAYAAFFRSSGRNAAKEVARQAEDRGMLLTKRRFNKKGWTATYEYPHFSEPKLGKKKKTLDAATCKEMTKEEMLEAIEKMQAELANR